MLHLMFPTKRTSERDREALLWLLPAAAAAAAALDPLFLTLLAALSTLSHSLA